MPVAGATSHSFKMPSPYRIICNIPRGLVVGLAALSGISNARDASLQTLRQHDGGLQTGDYPQRQIERLPWLQACPIKPSVPRCDPGENAVGRWLGGANDQPLSEDSEVLAHDRPRLKTASKAARNLDELVKHAYATMRGTRDYADIMEKAEYILRSYVSPPEDLKVLRLHDLRTLLYKAKGLESFMREACFLSYQLHGLAASASIDMPELTRSLMGRDAFASRIEMDFEARSASMNTRQVNTLLRLLASHMTAKNIRMMHN